MFPDTDSDPLLCCLKEEEVDTGIPSLVHVTLGLLPALQEQSSRVGPSGWRNPDLGSTTISSSGKFHWPENNRIYQTILCLFLNVALCLQINIFQMKLQRFGLGVGNLLDHFEGEMEMDCYCCDSGRTTNLTTTIAGFLCHPRPEI